MKLSSNFHSDIMKPLIPQAKKWMLMPFILFSVLGFDKIAQLFEFFRLFWIVKWAPSLDILHFMSRVLLLYIFYFFDSNVFELFWEY